MITYAKTYWGLHLLLRWYGSALPRTLIFAVVSSALTVFFYYIPHEGFFRGTVFNSFAYQLFATIVGFAMVFRTNFGYTRFWEGRTQLQAMSAALNDMASLALVYEAASLPPWPPSPSKRAPAQTPHQQQQRVGASPQPQREEGTGQQGPAGEAAAGGQARPGERSARVSLQLELASMTQARGLSQYSWQTAVQDFWQEQDQQQQQQQEPEQAEQAEGSGPGAQLQAEQQSQQGMPHSQSTQHLLPPLPLPLPLPQYQPQYQRRSGSGSLGRLSGIPPNQLKRFLTFREEVLHLTSLFHALALQHLRVDWRLDNLTQFEEAAPPPPQDARGLEGYHSPWINLFILRGELNKREAYNRAMKLPVIGIISGTRRELLRQSSEADPKVVTETMFSGLDHLRSASRTASARTRFGLAFLEQNTGSMVEGGPERVYTAYTWLQLLLAGRVKDGATQGWKVPAPVTTNVQRQLSAALAYFEQCRKLTDTPFPFPWSQTIVAFLLMYTLTIPILINSLVTHLFLGVILTFISVMTYWALNEVARDLEEPYIFDPNDLPLARHQFDFNKRLLAEAETVLCSLEAGFAADN